MEHIYHGSCHCGAIRFEAAIDLTLGTLRCNCSLCRKLRFWGALIAPASFRLLAGAEQLGVYQFGRHVERHLFCRLCGVHPFCRGHSAQRGAFYAVNLGCLDDMFDEQLANAPITYIDGRDERWDMPPVYTAHL